MKKKKTRKDNILKYSNSNYNSLNSLMKNIYYVKKGDFREEALAIRDVLDLFIDKGKFNKARDFFERDILKINNENLFENLTNVLYDLKRKYFERLEIIIFLQSLFHSLLIVELRKNKSFSIALNIGGLHLKEFLSIGYKDKFKKERDKTWLELYKSLMDSTLNTLYKTCNYLISDTTLNKENKKIYLETYLSELNKSLEYNQTITKYDFPKDNDEELKNFKKNLIYEKLELLNQLKLNLFFFILYNIDKDILQKDFFNLAYTLFKSGDLDSGLNEKINSLEFNDLEWLPYDHFRGGAQIVPYFKYDKYKLVIFFYNYLHDDKRNTQMKNLTKENFIQTTPDLERELKGMEKEFIKKYFEFNEKDFNTFKKVALKEIKTRVEETMKLEENYIINSDLKKGYVDQFKKDCNEQWRQKQERIEKILKIKKIKKENKDRDSFGQYTLFPKEWFLESFDKNVGLARTTGNDFGRDQAESKYRKILEEINLTFKKSKTDKQIKINDLYNDLIKNVKAGETYYLFYTGREIYNLPNMEWLREGIIIARLKIKDSEIYFCTSHIPEILFFEKGTFKLNQYLDKNGDELTIEIDDKYEEEEIKKILKTSKNLKTKEEVKKNVKIKVLEKFEVERAKGYKLMRLMI
ncbi:MAG: hypothetical protein KKC19_02345 [Nanoarchaeota archaeon]|nr:hypothetical protein [Nanoarchaeota archaeon]